MTGIPPGPRAEIDLVADAHRLTAAETERLLRAMTGAVPGNRDRALFRLAAAIARSGVADIYALVMPGNAHLGRVQTAFLDALMTAALSDAAAMAPLVAAIAAAPDAADDPVRDLARALGAVLTGWRRRALPEARHHNSFTAVRRFMARHRPADPLPRDGDAPPFWEAEATRDLLTRYPTALRALADYAEAARLAASWQAHLPLAEAEAAGIAPEAGADIWADPGADPGAEADADPCAAVDDPLAAPGLAAALAAVAAAPVKLLLAREREGLAALAELAPLVRGWPRDVQAALAFGPVQTRLIQALRRGDRIGDSAPFLAAAPSWEALGHRQAALGDAVMAALHLVALSCGHLRETGPGRSSLPVTQQRRIAAMARRQGFAGLTPAARAAALGPLIGPLLALHGMIAAHAAARARIGPARGAALHRAQAALFSRKLDALYAAPGTAAGAGDAP